MILDLCCLFYSTTSWFVFNYCVHKFSTFIFYIDKQNNNTIPKRKKNEMNIIAVGSRFYCTKMLVMDRFIAMISQNMLLQMKHSIFTINFGLKLSMGSICTKLKRKMVCLYDWMSVINEPLQCPLVSLKRKFFIFLLFFHLLFGDAGKRVNNMHNMV